MIESIDTLAGVTYQEAIRKILKGKGIGLFYETFGNAKEFIQDRAASSDHPLIRVQGLWAGKSHNYTDDYAQRAIVIAKNLEGIVMNTGYRNLLYSPFCEHRKDKGYIEELFRNIESIAPSLILVNSPISGGAFIKSTAKRYNEIHHNDKPAGDPGEFFGFSFDGLNAVDAQVMKYWKMYRKAIYRMIWNQHLNNTFNSKYFIENPLERTYRPGETDLKSYSAITGDMLPSEIANGWTLKTHSEQDRPKDPSGNKVVVLGPGRGKLEMKVNGKVIATAKHAEAERDHNTKKLTGRYLHRFSNWGFKYFKKSKKMGADGRIKLVHSGKSIGQIDTRYRQGTYRNKA